MPPSLPISYFQLRSSGLRSLVIVPCRQVVSQTSEKRSSNAAGRSTRSSRRRRWSRSRENTDSSGSTATRPTPADNPAAAVLLDEDAASQDLHETRQPTEIDVADAPRYRL